MKNDERERRKSGLAGGGPAQTSGLASSRAKAAGLGNVLPSDWDELSEAAKVSWCITKSFTGDYPAVCDEILAGSGGTGGDQPYYPPQQAGMSTGAMVALGAAGLGMLGILFMQTDED